MTDDKARKEAIRQHFLARHQARKAAMVAEWEDNIREAIGASPIETRMTIEDGIAFLRAGGERKSRAH
ncbi:MULTISPECIES: hypothetical protein [unclassified Rhizobium]|uniref:hypothetical protein n=1 Tax=unclassified Rhizobium TaxID=2613769 RepID=UPI0007EB11CF|nr:MULTISPECIES: hypothetical protein [unclassified Rhizobium]ANL11991.1 hypothetical protein AMJ98_PA00045 [Rhizobium sp. N1341]ANM42836.1 hypothetical protein AMK03_PA00045 [Rhizobium sp. N741]